MVDLGTIRAPLFVPANRPERFAKAAASGADAVILDLEDAVPADAKATARDALDCGFTGLPVIVRINAAGTPWHADDLAAVARLRVAAVMLPKSEDPADLARVSAAVGKPLIALVETGRGLTNARALAAAPGVVRIAFGSVDYCADLGCAHLREVLLPARSELVLAARLAGIAAPIDGVTTRLDDPAVTHDDAAHARALGMTGKLCIHPAQIAQVKRAFAPGEAEIDWARRVLASGDGAVSVDGAMVDEPVRIRARAILAQAE
ncbi:HpcH/HpaI aldolase/citrate lyase family protein [Ruixingdingia sedimenti]|uniref:CoA ester lyase n=1 Tax=Ruixingdingia sedimenti TaxID=3073604 RepID=A0ABU1F5J6_9RHOB|nr:CoA ester lyase [Xinfangfangia sp. LG-4]MDR5652131.1 CoA ester lyase [Xinfangfangia sp. LG-4]